MSSIIPLVCCICKTPCAPEDFYIRENGKRRKECKACFSARRKAYRAAHLDAAQARQRERYHERKDDPQYIQDRRDQWARHRDKSLLKKAEYRSTRREELNTKEHQRYHLKKDEINQKTREKRSANPDHFREIKRRTYWKHRDHQLQKSREWGLNNPELKRAGHRRWYQNNKEHIHELNIRWRRANRDQYRISAKMYQHKRRAKMRGQTFRWRDWLAMCAWFGNVCLCCGSDGALTVDHVVPVEHHGANLIENLQPLCLHCNTSKGAYHETDYRDPDRLAQFLQSIGH